jgi:hypothetical protein
MKRFLKQSARKNLFLKNILTLTVFLFIEFYSLQCFGSPLITFSGNDYAAHGFPQSIGRKFAVTNVMKPEAVFYSRKAGSNWLCFSGVRDNKFLQKNSCML